MVGAKEEVLRRYQRVFSDENLPRLTEEDFRGFLLIKNNRHWDGIHRHGSIITEDMAALRDALTGLLDEGQPLSKRLDKLYRRPGEGLVKGLGPATFTPILFVRYPEQYVVFNKKLETALKHLALWPDVADSAVFSRKYIEVHELLLGIAAKLEVDLWTLDALWWRVAESADEKATWRDELKSRIEETWGVGVEFTVGQVYDEFEYALSCLYPRNRRVQAKLRQTLQGLRDEEFLERVDRGVYRRVGEAGNEESNMALSLTDHQDMLAGFESAGYVCTRAPGSHANPLQIRWHVDGSVRCYRLWSFDITHGGGGPTVRSADEFRIQITNGPPTTSEFDTDGAVDLLIGYSRDRKAIVAYDRRWLEKWTQRKEETGSGGSPSVQVRSEDIQAGLDEGIHHLAKSAAFGAADIVTMRPTSLPAYLFRHQAILEGDISAEEARSAAPRPNETTVVEYCRGQGFLFDPDLIARYLAALLTKPFVILAGVSGTGKSKLAELVAEYYGVAPVAAEVSEQPLPDDDAFVFAAAKGPHDPTRFALVAVRPDWTDHQSILGFVNPITERYESTQALELVLRADRALRDAPVKAAAPRYFMLLDEMNLARVEHYFSDWLACSESRRPGPDGSVSQQPVPLHRSEGPMETAITQVDGSTETLPVPSSLALPTNLMVTGTVNVDETTHGFSPKVLDRAMVLEFDDVNLESLHTGTADMDAHAYRFPETLPPFQLATRESYQALDPAVHKHLVALNEILGEARLHLGYRAAVEVARFINVYGNILPEHFPDEDSAKEDRLDTRSRLALDAAVLQKVLPRLSGNRAKLEGPLAKLCAYLRDLEQSAADAKLNEFDPAAEARLPKSYRRAVDMLGSLRDFGFVSFFK